MNKNRLIALLVTLNLTLVIVVGWRELRPENVPEWVPRAKASVASLAAESPVLERRNQLVEIAERLSPSVVTIGASKTSYLINPFTSFFSDFTVYPYTERIPYLGSGVIIASEGLVVTNFHVLQGADDVFVMLTDGRELNARLLDADTVLDIALLRIEGDEGPFPTVKMGDSDSLMVGESVMALGNPFGNLIGDPKPTVTAGVISATKRDFRGAAEVGRVYQDMIQTDAAINPGNSGGALVNVLGELVGINTFIVSRSGGSQGIGFAIPINRVKSVVEEILLNGRIRSRYVDFRVQNLNPQLARRLQTNARSGAVVSEVAPSGPAARAGLRTGDIIQRIDGREVKDGQDVLLRVFTQQVGTRLRFEVLRNGREQRAEYEVSEAR